MITACCGEGCTKNDSSDTEDPEKEFLTTATRFIERGDYEQAASIYNQFIEKYSSHPYVDDAAYRLAYLRVIADQANPYFNYTQAVIFFEKFIETYPNSRYINACTNWLHVLKKINPAPADPVIITFKENSEPAEYKQLQKRLLQLEHENGRLKKTLEELQTAIER
jgi:TolA-binding protein